MDAMKIPALETDRLRMRQWRDGDLGVYASMCEDPEIMKYLGDGRVLNRMEAWRSMAMLLGHWQLRGFGMWVVTLREDDRMIGRAGFFQPEGWPGFEIGWTFARSAWGHGYATEAAQRALAYAVDVLGKDEVISVIHPDNARSIRVAERLGERLLRHDAIGEKKVLIYGMSLSR